jgi:ketosteroid isomerase-like protein
MTTALTIALDYHTKWAAKDVDACLALVADDVVCEAPAGRLQGAEAFRGFLLRYNEMFLGADLIAAYGDDDGAVLVTTNHTRPVPDAPSAARYTVLDGRITALQLIFDRLPYEQAASRR